MASWRVLPVMGRRAVERRDGGPNLLGIIEGQHAPAHDLTPFVALAGDQQHVARRQRGHGLTDRFGAIPISRPPGQAARMAARMAAASSVRGLSSVTIARSASRAAISPIAGRLPASRSPPQPNTQSSRPPVPTCGRRAARTVSRASGVWA